MKRYQIVIEGNVAVIIFKPKNRKEKVKVHDVREFIFGQRGYNQDTEKYPNYVHGEIWRQWENQKKQEIKG